MTTVIVFKSTDASAPTLTGQAGALLTVLDAVLVNGYGVGAQAAGAGWTKPFTNSGSIGCYRNSAVDGTGLCLHIDDSGTNNTAKEAMAVGFETLSALSTGTGQFPTAAQLNLYVSTPTGGVMIRKSNTADATARAWTIIADDTCFYMFIESGDYTNPTRAMPFMFGDIFSYKSSDAYRCLIIGRNAANSNAQTNDPFHAAVGTSASFLAQTIVGHYMPRHWTAASGSIIVGKHWDQTKQGMLGANSSTSGTTGIGQAGGCVYGLGNSQGSPSTFPYPNAPDGGLYMSPIWIHHSNGVRGYMKGAWAPLHDRVLGHGDTFSGTGTLSGKTFICLMMPGILSAVDAVCQVFIETSSTWS